MRVLVCLLLAASTVSAAELRRLKGEPLKGNVVSISPKEIVLDEAGKKVTTNVDDILSLVLSDDLVKFDPELKYHLVELTDGSQIKCATLTFKGKDVSLQTLQDQKLTIPVAKLNWVIHEANNLEHQRAFKERVQSRKKAYDIIAIKREDVIQPFEGTIGDVNPMGDSFEFTQKDGTKRSIAIDRALIMFFQRQADAAARPVACRLTDVHRNLIYVSELKKEPDGYSLITSAGVELKYTDKNVAKFDYSKGKLTYLSEMTPTNVKETNTEGRIDHFKRDENLEGGKIRLAGTEYRRGLAMHSTTEIEYDLEGEYRELKGVVGIDDDIGGGDDAVVLKVYLDNVERLNWNISRKDKERARNLLLNVKDVQKLKIVVTTGDLLDLGKHLTLADIRVSK